MFGAIGDVLGTIGDAVENAASSVASAASDAGSLISDGLGVAVGVLEEGVEFTGEAASFTLGAGERFGRKVWEGFVDTIESATDSPLGFLETVGLSILTLPLGPALMLYKAGDAVVEEADERS